MPATIPTSPAQSRLAVSHQSKTIHLPRTYPIDAAHQFAYRHLLFFAMIDIRQISGLADQPERLFNPATSKEALAWIARAGDIANWLENLAGFSSDNFEGFDEDRFWQEHAEVCESFPDVATYRDWFERRLKDFPGIASAV